MQPFLVTSFAIKQAAECVRSILKIDDIVSFFCIYYFLNFILGFGNPLKNVISYCLLNLLNILQLFG